MKKSVRLFLSGSIQQMFYEPYIKKEAEALNVRGYVRTLEDKRIELFLEGDHKAVDSMIAKCKTGPYNTKVQQVDMKDERYQDFKDFKIMRI